MSDFLTIAVLLATFCVGIQTEYCYRAGGDAIFCSSGCCGTHNVTCCSSPSNSKEVTCKFCHDVNKPGNCRMSIDCGTDEICMTEEFTDINGLKAYRLGCANAERCRLFTNAQSLFGKRQTSTKCYQCCDRDDCNANLCHSSGDYLTTWRPMITRATDYIASTTRVTPMGKSSGCPEFSVPFQDKCYIFGPASTYWRNARRFCSKHGGNLVSVNSKEEHDFLKGLLIKQNATFISKVWTGGSYFWPAHQYEYVDGSPFNYTLWYSNTTPSLITGIPYFVFLHNPASSPLYKDLPMDVTSSSTIEFSFICEIPNI